MLPSSHTDIDAMVRKRLKAARVPVITRLGVRVDASDIRVEAGVNIDAKHPQYAQSFNEEDLVYTYVTRVTFKGVLTYPSERAGDRYEIAVSGDEAPSRHVSPTLKQLQERDEFGSPNTGTTEVAVFRSNARSLGWGLSIRPAGKRHGTGGLTCQHAW